MSIDCHCRGNSKFKSNEQALQIGLVAEVHPPERLLPRAQVCYSFQQLVCTMHILVDYSSPTLITSFVQRRQELICSYHLVCAYIKLEFKEEQITMMKICLKMMIPMVHFAC